MEKSSSIPYHALLADRGPNLVLRSGKFGPKPNIGTKFRPSHFFGQELTVCLMHAVERAIPQIAVKTFYGGRGGTLTAFRSSSTVKTCCFFWSLTGITVNPQIW